MREPPSIPVPRLLLAVVRLAEPGLVAALVASAMATGLLAGWQALLLKDLLEGLSAVQAAWDAPGAVRDLDPLVRTGWKLLALALPTAAAAWASCLAGRTLATRATARIRERCLDHLLRLDLTTHHRLARADLLQRLTSDLQAVLILQLAVFGRLVQRPLETVFLLACLAWLSPLLAVGVLLVLVPVGLITTRVRGEVRRTSVEASASAAANLQVLEQVTAGIRIVQAHGSEDAARARYAVVGAELAAIRRRMDGSRARSEGITQGAVVLLAGAGMLVGALLFSRQLIAPATLLTALGIIVRLTAAQRDTHLAWLDVAENLAPAARVFQLLALPLRPADPPDAVPCPTPPGAIRLHQVRFRHGPDSAEVLAGIDLEIPVGATVALVGESGSGKSTLIDLLARLHDPTGGAITVGGHDLRRLARAGWSRQVAVVPQDCFLFDTSIRENIRLGLPGADDEAVEQAARRAHLHAAILGLEGGQGYDTPVGDRGCRLSGGQRQRVAIARALLRDAPVLLLDEPTSALDADSEAQVQAALAEVMRGRTVVIAAHRLATIQHADLIAVLAPKDAPDRGTLREVGSPAGLLARDGLYARLVGMQQLAT